MASERIDFREEWGRHETVLGREDVLGVLDGSLLEGPPRGWVLVKGGPGMDKSALLTEWLKRREAAGQPLPPHHFRPKDAVPGKAHEAVARLGVRAILTTNYDLLLEETRESPRRTPYTWKESHLALNDLKPGLNDLESGRNVLLKVHGTAERHDTVVMSELEYHKVRSDASYQRVLSHLLQGYTFLFIGYGMNDPLDLDLVLKWNADAFKSAARRHYALLKDPSDNDRDRYEREYNVKVIPFSDYAQLPDILDELGRAAAIQATGT